MLTPGTQLGRYVVSHRLGAGGMGDVYVALDTTLDRHVAVKVLPESVAADHDRVARFLREAKAASALNHPGILTVHDFGQHDATHFLVTELVDGKTLRAWVNDARPALPDLLGAIAQAASALAAAHAAGVVHRDVKPENLMRRSDGLVKVLDFGIAKLTSPAGPTADTGADTAPGALTHPGAVLGTASYMSPEQASGEAVDARTDVWSLGVVLYELLAGKLPFAADTPMGVLVSIVARDPEPLEAAAPWVPESVRRVVATALRKPKDERFASAAELASALERSRQELVSGVAPAVETVGVQEEVATRALPAVGEAHPPEPPTNLRPPHSELIGRGRELEEVTGLLRAGSVRLLTLTGPGGTGKTRLAVEAARALWPEYADGAFAVDLSTLSDPERIAAHVAAVFRLAESPERTIAEELERYLATRRLLLVLDNFEHLLEGAAVVSRLLAAAPGLRVLATSRALLHLSAEREYAVEPLEVPRFTSLPPVEELGRTPAVALFVERAREAKASFTLTAENARAVVEICRRLDGLPLALELAAARVKLLTPSAMLERLDRSLKLLTGGARDLPARQQTMRGAVAWSYELLDGSEAAVLRRLAVFAGGCTLEAAEAVCGSVAEDVLEAVGSLVDKSLLRQREQEDGEARFLMLEVVREFALERLEAEGEAEAARLEHGRFFLRMAEEAAPKVRGEHPAEWLERLWREVENLRAALALQLREEPEAGARLAQALGAFWSLRNLQTEARGWMTKALSAGVADLRLRAGLLGNLSLMERELGDLGAAIEHGRAAVEAIRGLADPALLANTLGGLGICLLFDRDYRGGREALEEGLAIARGHGLNRITANILTNLGEGARAQGDYGTARGYYEQALEVEGCHLRTAMRALVLENLGAVSLEQGDHAGARAYYREGLAISSELGNALLSAYALDGLAAAALAGGQPEVAARLAGAAEAISEQTDARLEPLEQALRDRCVAKLREALDAETLGHEWARGRAMTLGEAVEEGLRE